MKFFSCFQRYERIILLRRKWLPERLRLFTAIHNNRPIAYGRPHVKFRGGLHLPLPRHCSQVSMEQLQSVLAWLQQASANFMQRPNAGQSVTQHESVSQTTRHDIPTSQIYTTAHLAQTSFQSRATLFYSIVPLRPTLRCLMFHCLRQVCILSIHPPYRVYNSERV